MKRLILAAAAALVLPIAMPSMTQARVLREVEPARGMLLAQDREPDVYERRNGRLEVRFRSGCRMIFSRAGKPLDAQRCSRRQEARAHDAVSRYMRRHGDAVRRGRGPQINELRGGRLQVVFRAGCRMIFDRRGRAIDAQRCNRAQESRASDAVASYMRRHGRRGRPDHRGRRGPHLIEHRNGRLEVAFPSGCRVHFNRRGRAVDAQRCSRDQESTARKMAARYLAARRRR